jgi:hypothetical protein
MMKRYPSCRRLVAAALVACVSRPTFAEIVPTAARRDTTIPYTGRWRDELPAMLGRIASTLDSGFAARERTLVLEELGAIRPRLPHDRYTRVATRSYVVQVRFRGRASVLSVYGYWPDTSRVSFYLRSPDTLLLGAIDSTFRAARRALLSAPRGVRLHLEEASVWNGSTPAMDVLLDVAPAAHCPHFGLETQSESRGDTVALHVDGAAPRDSCPQDYWPTGMGQRRPGTPGRYQVAMDYEGDTNRFVIDVSDSSLALSTIRSTFVTADERIRWRVPSGSVVLTCSRLAAGRDSICKELQSWATRQVGLQRVVFDTASGVSPLRYNAGAYRYDDRALANLRRCVSTIHPVMRQDWAIALEVRPRTGPWMVDRVFNPSDVPRVATDPSCGLPPSIADYGKTLIY